MSAHEGLRLDSLQHDYPGFTLGPVSLDVHPGVTAVLGPNGSGKSTFIRALLGLLPGSTGEVLWSGSDLRARASETLRDVAYVSDDGDDVYEQLTALEYWRFVAAIRGHSYGEDADRLVTGALELADRLALEQLEQRISGYSLGMRRKTQLIGALMTRPRLLVVDEPQNGLDFFSSHELRTVLTEIAAGGGTVLMSNHDLDSVARTADRIVVLNQGRVAGDRRLDDGSSGHDLEHFVRDSLQG